MRPGRALLELFCGQKMRTYGSSAPIHAIGAIVALQLCTSLNLAMMLQWRSSMRTGMRGEGQVTRTTMTHACIPCRKHGLYDRQLGRAWYNQFVWLQAPVTHRRELVHTLCKRINENLLGLQLLVDLGLADREQASNAFSPLSKA